MTSVDASGRVHWLRAVCSAQWLLAGREAGEWHGGRGRVAGGWCRASQRGCGWRTVESEEVGAGVPLAIGTLGCAGNAVRCGLRGDWWGGLAADGRSPNSRRPHRADHHGCRR